MGRRASRRNSLQMNPPPTVGRALGHFRENRSVLANIFRMLLRRFWAVIPGTPPEVLWAFAEVAELHILEPDEKLVTEHEVGEAAGAVILIDKGTALVQKEVVEEPSQGQKEIKTTNASCAILGPGSVIGEILLCGANVPRPATVRAATRLEAVSISPSGIVDVLARFSGVLAGMSRRMDDFATQVQTTLSTRAETIASVKLFASCDAGFLNALGRASDVQIFFAGQVVKAEGSDDGTLYIIEFGSCAVEVAGRGIVARIPTGDSFGDRTLLGVSMVSNATVRAATPLVLALAVQRHVFTAMLVRYPSEQAGFHEKANNIAQGTGGQAGKSLTHIPVFKRCRPGFLEAISRAAQTRSYVPGQTIVVQGQVDAAQMFVLKGGKVAVEIKGGKWVAQLPSGSSFGELAMLGVVGRRSVTIRAMAFCVTTEIPRAAFLAALESHPEERSHFETLALQHAQNITAVRWPVLDNLPSRFAYLLNLYAERRVVNEGDRSLNKPEVRSCAIVVLWGRVGVWDERGGQRTLVDELTCGACGCFNPLVLLQRPPQDTGEVLSPLSTCEVQIISAEKWEKVISEFPMERPTVLCSVLRLMAEKAEGKLGCEPTSSELLRTISVFKQASNEFALLLRQGCEVRLFDPGDTICREDVEGDRMFIVLQGSARAEDALGPEEDCEFKPGHAFGLAVGIGISLRYSRTVRADGYCLVHILRTQKFKDALALHPREALLYDAALKQAEKHNCGRVMDRLVEAEVIAAGDPDFSSALCRHADDDFYGPGEVIIRRGDTCTLGESPAFVMLAGSAEVEDFRGILLARLNPGDLFGEAGALGVEPQRNATVRAVRGILSHCARLNPVAVKRARATFPDATMRLETLFAGRKAANAEFAERRRRWIESTVVPALAAAPILAGLSEDLLALMAEPLHEVTHAKGDVVAKAGEPANSMFVLLAGTLEVCTRMGEVVGTITGGASFGEVSVLDLFPMRTATLRATESSRALEVPREAIESPMERDAETWGLSKEALEQIAEDRRDQVERGLPMCALPIGVGVEDVAVRAIALQAERIDLAPGEIWQPLLDTSPGGPHFGVLAHGRAVLELGSDGRSVMPMVAGGLFLEGLAAEFGARLRATSACEGYRIRCVDFQVAVSSIPVAFGWYYRYQLLEKETRQHVRVRLTSEIGFVKSKESHPSDDGIREWKARRQDSMNRARHLRRERAHEQNGLPLTPPFAEQRATCPRPHSSPAGRSGNLSRTCSSQPGRPGSSPPGRTGESQATTHDHHHHHIHHHHQSSPSSTPGRPASSPARRSASKLSSSGLTRSGASLQRSPSLPVRPRSSPAARSKGPIPLRAFMGGSQFPVHEPRGKVFNPDLTTQSFSASFTSNRPKALTCPDLA